MSTVLVINSSILGSGSASRQMVDHSLQRLLAIEPQARVIQRDLGAEPIPHLSEANWAGVRGTPSTAIELETRALSDQLLDELRTADTLLIGAPMYNFSLPTALRSWFDHVLRAGETFRYGASGPQGLLSGKRVIVIESRGGLYSEGPAQALDFQEPYLRQLFAFMGLTDVHFLRLEKLGSGAEARAAALESAKASLESILDAQFAQAA
ncbi:FMN-dependent NADH-azoreductase [Pseudomarimonas arenosa]|uniref:FMN dependent NADH:quinone oxidoreductase n=1 Tax=Pseudomarimonas arenosa TaxID=2774145 RepID=A0AAW3ZQA2_9GAMM|nr:FMN-dependent NADH-azoreductase [Pseudomarimonas arenosa]MBD8528133.1 FMN-dependent NADH-azoreductase [Pseudomarimonas arenosa]